MAYSKELETYDSSTALIPILHDLVKGQKYEQVYHLLHCLQVESLHSIHPDNWTIEFQTGILLYILATPNFIQIALEHILSGNHQLSYIFLKGFQGTLLEDLRSKSAPRKIFQLMQLPLFIGSKDEAGLSLGQVTTSLIGYYQTKYLELVQRLLTAQEVPAAQLAKLIADDQINCSFHPSKEYLNILKELLLQDKNVATTILHLLKKPYSNCNVGKHFFQHHRESYYDLLLSLLNPQVIWDTTCPGMELLLDYPKEYSQCLHDSDFEGGRDYLQLIDRAQTYGLSTAVMTFVTTSTVFIKYEELGKYMNLMSWLIDSGRIEDVMKVLKDQVENLAAGLADYARNNRGRKLINEWLGPYLSTLKKISQNRSHCNWVILQLGILIRSINRVIICDFHSSIPDLHKKAIHNYFDVLLPLVESLKSQGMPSQELVKLSPGPSDLRVYDNYMWEIKYEESRWANIVATGFNDNMQRAKYGVKLINGEVLGEKGREPFLGYRQDMLNYIFTLDREEQLELLENACNVKHSLGSFFAKERGIPFLWETSSFKNQIDKQLKEIRKENQPAIKSDANNIQTLSFMGLFSRPASSPRGKPIVHGARDLDLSCPVPSLPITPILPTVLKWPSVPQPVAVPAAADKEQPLEDLVASVERPQALLS